jgi:zinc transporter ZupT
VNSREDHDVPVASIVGAEPEALFEEGALSTLSSAQKKQLFDSMFQEMYFEGEEIFHKLDSMSPMYYIVSGRVRLTENGSISWRDSGMLLGAEVLDIAAGRNGPRMQEAVAMCSCTVLRLQLDDFRGLMGHDASLERDLQAAVQLYTSMGDQRRTLLVVPGREENAGGAGADDTVGVPKKICKEPSWDFSMQRGTLINRSRRLSTTLGALVLPLSSRGSVVATSNSPEGSGPEWMVGQRREAGPDSDERATSQEFSPGRVSVEEREIPDHILEKDDIAGALGEDLNKDKNTAIMIWLGILIDAIPESMVIGFIVSRGSRNPLVFVVGVFLSNFPEALASAATMKQVGLSVLTIMSLWTSTFIVTGVGALIGAAIMPEKDDAGQFELFVKGMEGLAAGAMLTMIAQCTTCAHSV